MRLAKASEEDLNHTVTDTTFVVRLKVGWGDTYLNLLKKITRYGPLGETLEKRNTKDAAIQG